MMGSAKKNNNPEDGSIVYTYSEKESQIAEKLLNKVLIADINNNVSAIDIPFDCIIFSHILEHTNDPVQVLRRFSKLLTQQD